MFRPGNPLPSADQSTEAGQPRPEEDAQQPTAAERVRTLVDSHGMASLTVPGVQDSDEIGFSAPAVRTVDASGDVLLLVPGDCAAARAAAHAQDDDVTAVMEITDVAPVSVPHRIRGRAWIAGWLTPVRNADRSRAAMLLAERHPVGELLGIGEALQPDPTAASGRAAWTMLRLEVGEATVDDLWGAASVEPEEFVAATPDPVAGHEAELLQHLHTAHGEQVRELCGLLGERAERFCAARGEVIPVALDRFGLRVRFADPEHHVFDARFDFPSPVQDLNGLRRAMHHLFDAAS